MFNVRRILLPTDFGHLAVAAAGIAVSVARAYGAALHVVHVAPALTPPPLPTGTPQTLPASPAEDVLAPAQAGLDQFVQEHLGSADCPVTAQVLLGAPAEQICRHAVDAHADLIVIGTHAAGILRRVLLGSVSKAVLESAPCPVLMVPVAAVAADEKGA